MIDILVGGKVRADGINVGNLEKLRNYTRDYVRDEFFDMGEYMTDKYDHNNSCRTVGCLLGWTKVMMPKLWAQLDLGYDAFAEAVYGITYIDDVRNFLFSVNWEKFDNSRAGAIKRIEFVLANEGFDYMAGRKGNESRFKYWYKLYN